MVHGHNVSSGGALPILVTLIGWITLIKGALFLFLPPETESSLILDTLHLERFLFIPRQCSCFRHLSHLRGVRPTAREEIIAHFKFPKNPVISCSTSASFDKNTSRSACGNRTTRAMGTPLSKAFA
jgi:hypothetical protein